METIDSHIELPSKYYPQTTKYDVDEQGFKAFLKLWNQQVMKLTTPQIHLDIADWLEWSWERGDDRLLLMAFRSAGKSTIVGLFAAWLLYRKPELRILVLAADHMLAKKMVQNVKRILEKHPLTSAIKPKKAEQWAGDRFTVSRMFELRDPSMLAKGITSNITGSRADIIICDDVEVPNTCDTPEKRRELRDRLGEMEYVLTPDGTQLYVGTPHHYNTIYAKEPHIDLGEEQEFLSGFKRLEIPVLKQSGQSAWPEKFGEARIKQMKRAAGPNKFASQMMLEPRNIAEGRLNTQLMSIYDEEIEYSKELRTLFLGNKKLVSASAFWDPSFGSAIGDHSVMAVVFNDEDGHYYLQHIAYIKTNERDARDEATQQCTQIADIAKSHFLPSITVETNGLGKFLPNMLRNALAQACVPCKVNELHQKQNKEERILDAFDAILAARRLSVHKSVLQTPFITEMQEWRPACGKGHDDGLDAVAGALAQMPDRLKRIYGKGAHSWMRGKALHKAETRFKI